MGRFHLATFSTGAYFAVRPVASGFGLDRERLLLCCLSDRYCNPAFIVAFRMETPPLDSMVRWNILRGLPCVLLDCRRNLSVSRVKKEPNKISRAFPAPLKVHRIQTARDLQDEWFASAKTVGITARTSTPDALVEEVEQHIRQFATKSENHFSHIT